MGLLNDRSKKKKNKKSEDIGVAPLPHHTPLYLNLILLPRASSFWKKEAKPTHFF